MREFIVVDRNNRKYELRWWRSLRGTKFNISAKEGDSRIIGISKGSLEEVAKEFSSSNPPKPEHLKKGKSIFYSWGRTSDGGRIGKTKTIIAVYEKIKNKFDDDTILVLDSGSGTITEKGSNIKAVYKKAA